MKPIFECTKKSYVVEVDDETWNASMWYDDEIVVIPDLPGVYDIEFNGHFGKNFFFTCNTEDDRVAKENVTRFLKNVVKKTVTA